MKIGYLLDTHATSYGESLPPEEVAHWTDQLFAEAEAADRYGFDAVFVPERHGRSECVFPTPFLLLAGLASRVRRIRLGTCVALLPLYHPMHVAEQSAVLDSMTRGRFILGVGSGFDPAYNQMFGIPMVERRRRFDEGLAIIKGAWAQRPFSYAGALFTLREVSLWPRPYSVSAPPIWIASWGGTEYALRRAALEGDAWVYGGAPIERNKWRHLLDCYRGAAQAAERSTYVVLLRDGWVASSREEAARIWGGTALQERLYYFRSGAPHLHPDFRSEGDFTVDRLSRHWVMGSPTDCIEQLRTYAEHLEVDYVIVRFRMPGGPGHQAVLECIQRFAEEVIPYV